MLADLEALSEASEALGDGPPAASPAAAAVFVLDTAPAAAAAVVHGLPDHSTDHSTDKLGPAAAAVVRGLPAAARLGLRGLPDRDLLSAGVVACVGASRLDPALRLVAKLDGRRAAPTQARPLVR